LPSPIPSLDKFAERRLRWIDAFAGGVLCDQARKLNLSVSFGAFETGVADAALTSDGVSAKVEF
jgi:hypothetical protein